MIKIKSVNGRQSILIILLTSFFLFGCTQPAENPKHIADTYWQLIQAGNAVEAENLISINSRPAYSKNNHRKTAIEQFSNSDATTIVNTTITTTNPHSNLKQTQSFETYLVLQHGQWKVDASRTQIPASASATEQEMQQLAEELSESMQDNIESIDEAMNQGMQMLNDALRDGSKDMGDSLLQLMNELNNTMHESIDKMKQRRQKELQKQAPQKNKPSADNGEGMI